MSTEATEGHRPEDLGQYALQDWTDPRLAPKLPPSDSPQQPELPPSTAAIQAALSAQAALALDEVHNDTIPSNDAAPIAVGKKRGRPPGARNKASRLQMVPAVLILRPRECVRTKIRAYAEKHNLSVSVMGMSGALQSMTLTQVCTGQFLRRNFFEGPLTVMALNGCVIRETVDGTVGNTVEKSCWMNLCCATPTGTCIGGSVSPEEDMISLQMSTVLLSTWEPLKMDGLLENMQYGPLHSGKFSSLTGAATQRRAGGNGPNPFPPGSPKPPHSTAAGQQQQPHDPHDAQLQMSQHDDASAAHLQTLRESSPSRSHLHTPSAASPPESPRADAERDVEWHKTGRHFPRVGAEASQGKAFRAALPTPTGKQADAGHAPALLHAKVEAPEANLNQASMAPRSQFAPPSYQGYVQSHLSHNLLMSIPPIDQLNKHNIDLMAPGGSGVLSSMRNMSAMPHVFGAIPQPGPIGLPHSLPLPSDVLAQQDYLNRMCPSSLPRGPVISDHLLPRSDTLASSEAVAAQQRILRNMGIAGFLPGGMGQLAAGGGIHSITPPLSTCEIPGTVDTSRSTEHPTTTSDSLFAVNHHV